MVDQKDDKIFVTSETFRSSSPPSSKAKEIDPQNILLFLMLISDELKLKPFVIQYLSSGRLQLDRIAEGKPEGKNSPRRAVYRQIKRNSLDTFLTVFDAPVPSSAKGRRDITNVPAQSLTLMNDPESQKLQKNLAIFIELVIYTRIFQKCFESHLVDHH